MSEFQHLKSAREACEYLAKRWGRESYSMEAFSKLRQRRNLEPAFSAAKETFWTTEQLDQIEEPDLSKKRAPRKKRSQAGGQNSPSSMIISGFSRQVAPLRTQELIGA